VDSKNSGIALMVGGALLAFGSFLAWGTRAFGIGVTGMDGGDGWFTLIAGVIVLAAGYMNLQPPRPTRPGWRG
jgi:hypothetical protein